MSKRILITGGAGFIGSHLADELLEHGYQVRILDNLAPQVHGSAGKWPAYLSPQVEVINGDIRDAEMVTTVLKDSDVVYHLAAAVGVGQSMYEIAEYTRVNNVGAAVLLQALSDQPVERLIVASSMSIYGEGLYRDSQGQIYDRISRRTPQVVAGQWELTADNGEPLCPLPTPETKPPRLASVYALSKYDQEQMSLIVGEAYDIPTVALRFFNVYGPRQALSNPYTGVLAIFAARLLSGRRPLIYEDGCQKRDFVHVRDVARACRLALEAPEAAGRVFNIGSGRAYTIRMIADRLAEIMGREHLRPQITAKFRVGDIRHCFANIGLARRLLGYEPQVSLEEGLTRLATWLDGQIAGDQVDQAHAELLARRLAV